MNSNQTAPSSTNLKITNSKPKIKGTLDRNDNTEDLNTNRILQDETESLRKENLKLEYILNKYNLILNEYQIKYGNEIFEELNHALSPEVIDSLTNTAAKSDFKRILVENVALIKEYEKTILENKKNSDFLSKEMNRFKAEIEKIVKENSQLREELENAKEEQNILYKKILNKENLSDTNINNIQSQTNQIPMRNSYLNSKSGNLMNTTANLNINNNSSCESFEILKSQNEQLLQLIEKTKFDYDQCNLLLSDYKEKYEVVLSSYENLETNCEKILKENESLASTKKFAEEKLKEYNRKIIEYEKRTNSALQNLEKAEIDNKYLKKLSTHYKESYEEMEKRKNLENEVLTREIQEIRERLNQVTERLNNLQEINSDLKFENNKLNSELNVIKYDCDHMTKIFEESNFAIKTAEEKERHIEEIVKNYKMKIEEANIEKEKSLLRQTLLEKQITKISEDYSKLLSEKQAQYENFIDNSNEKFKQILEIKEEEISNLKNDNLANKIEKDKFTHEYSVIKKEYDKLLEIFRCENEKYIKKFEDSERNSNRISNHLNDKVNVLSRKIEKLEHEKSLMENELNACKSNEKNYSNLVEKLNKSDEFSFREVSKYRKENEQLLKEKEFYEGEIERITNLYETKMRQLKEQNDLKVTVLENLIKQKQEDFCSSEDKAFEILKKQENVNIKIM